MVRKVGMYVCICIKHWTHTQESHRAGYLHVCAGEVKSGRECGLLTVLFFKRFLFIYQSESTRAHMSEGAGRGRNSLPAEQGA